MYELIETTRGIPQTTRYPTLHEGIDALTRRATAVARMPGTTILTQRPRRFVAAGRHGERVTLSLRRGPASHTG